MLSTTQNARPRQPHSARIVDRRAGEAAEGNRKIKADYPARPKSRPDKFVRRSLVETHLRTHAGTEDELVAMGVTINSGAQFSFDDLGNSAFPPGTVLTAINNTAATPIAGTFSNLPDGAPFSSNSNTYQVSYQGAMVTISQ